MKKTGLLLGLAMTATIGLSDVVVKYSVATNDPPAQARAYTTSTATSFTWNFSASTPLFGGVAANGTKIYGGIIESGTAVVPALNIGVATSGRLVATATGTGAQTVKGLLLWDKADFLAGSASTLAFDATSSLWINAFRNDGTGRWVIRNGNTCYVSDATFATGINSLPGTASVQWAAWDPTANGGANFADIPVSGFSSQTFTNVSGVGIFFSDSRNSLARFTIDSNGFTANLSAIPEPATLSLIGLLSTALLFIRRTFMV